MLKNGLYKHARIQVEKAIHHQKQEDYDNAMLADFIENGGIQRLMNRQLSGQMLKQ